jgi:hypothetical protein
MSSSPSTPVPPAPAPVPPPPPAPASPPPPPPPPPPPASAPGSAAASAVADDLIPLSHERLMRICTQHCDEAERRRAARPRPEDTGDIPRLVALREALEKLRPTTGGAHGGEHQLAPPPLPLPDAPAAREPGGGGRKRRKA